MASELHPGVLTFNNRPLAVEIACASKVSLFVDFADGQTVPPDSRFAALSLTIGEVTHDLGPSRLLPAGPGNHYAGKLVLTDQVYDFPSLFSAQKVVTVEDLYGNLALTLMQKDKIRPNFVTYMAGLTYDLKVYRLFFDEIDQKFLAGDEQAKDLVFAAIAKNEGAKFLAYFDDKLHELEALIADFSQEEHRNHGFYLRKQVWDVILCSEFILHCNLKPRGYAGDSELMRMIYENDYRGASTFGKLLYKYSLDHPAAVAVRNRKIMIPRYLRQVADSLPASGGALKLMSVACGPAYELSDIIASPADAARYDCTLLDQDAEALGEAADNIQLIEARIGCPVQVHYLEDSVRTMLRTRDLPAKWGQFHFIYSMGLFDYLTPSVAKAIVEKIYELLLPGGQLLIGNYHYSNVSRWFLEYWHDWVLYYRAEDEFMELLADTDAMDISVMFDDSGTQMFLSARKPPLH